MREWSKTTTDSLFSFVTSGSRGWAQYYSEEGAPFIRIGDLERGTLKVDWQNAQRVSPPKDAEGARTRVQAGDVLVSITADVGIIGVVPTGIPEAYINQHVALARPVAGVLPRFLGWFLDSGEGQRQFRDLRRGATKVGLGLPDVRSVEVPVPTLDEQNRIVEAIETHFSRLDAAVALLQRSKANLKRARASVLKAAVEGRLVPTEAELAALGVHHVSKEHEPWERGPPGPQATAGAGADAEEEGQRSRSRRARRPALPGLAGDSTSTNTYEPASVLLEHILAERRAQWTGKGKYKEPAAPETEGLPDLPEGWVWASVEQLAASEERSLCDGPFGSNLKTEHYTDSGPRVIRLQNIGDGVFRDEYAHITRTHFESLRKHEVQPGDLVIASLGEVLPRACLIPSWLGPAIVKADCIRMQPSTDLVMGEYLNAALNSPTVRKRTTERVHGVGRPRLGLTGVREISIPLPPLAEQRRIVAEVDRRLSVLNALETTVDTNLARCARLRQAILKRAFEGRLVPPQGPAYEDAEPAEGANG